MNDTVINILILLALVIPPVGIFAWTEYQDRKWEKQWDQRKEDLEAILNKHTKDRP